MVKASLAVQVMEELFVNKHYIFLLYAYAICDKLGIVTKNEWGILVKASSWMGRESENDAWEM